MHLGSRGLRLKAGTQRLSGKEALAYARSRHTSDDYDRSRRQQQVIVAAAEQVRKRGLSALPALVELARKKTAHGPAPARGAALLELAVKADLATPRSIVLEPVALGARAAGQLHHHAARPRDPEALRPDHQLGRARAGCWITGHAREGEVAPAPRGRYLDLVTPAPVLVAHQPRRARSAGSRQPCTGGLQGRLAACRSGQWTGGRACCRSPWAWPERPDPGHRDPGDELHRLPVPQDSLTGTVRLRLDAECCGRGHRLASQH